MRKSLCFNAAILVVILTTLTGGGLLMADTAEAPSDPRNNRQKLAEFARTMKLTRPAPASGSASPPIHITNKNLVFLADGVNLTEVTTKLDPPINAEPSETGAPGVLHGDLVTPTGTDDSQAVANVKREYWRNRYLAAKQELRDAESDLTFLDEEIPRLWTLFYSTDDPAYRDRVIKPKLDDAINRRETAVVRIEEKRSALPKILTDAQKDGALPGWFRDIK